MKRKLLLPVLALTAFLGTLLSCSSDSDTASIQIPVTQIFRNVEKDILPSDTNKIKLEITLSGDAKDSRTFNWEEKERNCTFENLPVGGVVSVSAKVKDGEDLIYSGESDKIKLKNEQNEITITMQKLMARLTVKTDNKEIAGLTDETEIVIDASAEGFSSSWTITPSEFAAGYELKYLPATGKITITAKVKDGENLLFSGSHVAENIKENQDALTIQMTKHFARLTVKTASNEIPALQKNLVKILITVTGQDFRNKWEATPQEFSSGHEIKYLPTNKELTVTAEAKTTDTTDTAIFRGNSTIKIAENDQNPECTIEMKRVNGDASVEIRTLPTPKLKANPANGTKFSLTQDTEPPVARFTIYYTDSSTNPDKPTPKTLPEWVTYKWKMNGTEFTPNDNSGEATLGMDEGTEGRTLTIYLKKMKSLLPLGSQNSLYVEIGMENSDETKSTEIEFTITQ